MEKIHDFSFIQISDDFYSFHSTSVKNYLTEVCTFGIFNSKSQEENVSPSNKDSGFLMTIIYVFGDKRGSLEINEINRLTLNCLSMYISSFVKIFKIRRIAFNSSKIQVIVWM